MNFIFQFVRLVGASNNTIATADTSFRKKLNLRMRISPLGIVAPEAAQRAALEKHRCPNAWPIVNRESLDVENESFRVQLFSPLEHIGVMEHCSVGVLEYFNLLI